MSSLYLRPEASAIIFFFCIKYPFRVCYYGTWRTLLRTLLPSMCSCWVTSLYVFFLSHLGLPWGQWIYPNGGVYGYDIGHCCYTFGRGYLYSVCWYCIRYAETFASLCCFCAHSQRWRRLVRSSGIRYIACLKLQTAF